MSGLVFWVLNLYLVSALNFWMSELILWVSGRADGRTRSPASERVGGQVGGRAGGRAAQGHRSEGFLSISLPFGRMQSISLENICLSNGKAGMVAELARMFEKVVLVLGTTSKALFFAHTPGFLALWNFES